jgi:hypothetical protein
MLAEPVLPWMAPQAFYEGLTTMTQEER